jgi:hypothetical protein
LSNIFLAVSKPFGLVKEKKDILRALIFAQNNKKIPGKKTEKKLHNIVAG